jgi:hypothetical protein
MSEPNTKGPATLREIQMQPDAKEVVAQAAKSNLTQVVIYGYDEANEPYFAASTSDLAEVAFILTRAMHKLNIMADQKA